MNVDKIKGLYPNVSNDLGTHPPKTPDFVYLKFAKEYHRMLINGRRIMINRAMDDAWTPFITKRIQKEKEREKVIERNKTAFRIYRKQVRLLTELVADQIPGIELRGFTSHHIDHIKSIWYCWKNEIPAEEAASISNLRMLPYQENMAKGIKCI